MSTNINTDINSVMIGTDGANDTLRSNTKSLLIGGGGNDALNGTGNTLPQLLVGDSAVIVNLTPRVYTDGLTRFTPTVQVTGEIMVDGKAVRVLLGESSIADSDSYQTLTTNGTLDILVSLSHDISSVANVQVGLGYTNEPFPAVWNQYQVNTIRVPGTTTSWNALGPNADNDEDHDINTADQGRFIREGRWVAIPNTQTNATPIATSGDDWLRGAANDTLIGGTGNDLYSIGNAGNSVRIVEVPSIPAEGFNPAIHVNGGDDTVSGIFTSYVLPKGVEHLEYTPDAQAALVTLTGNSESNSITPTGGGTFSTPTLQKGLAGNDTLQGGNGRDTLEGSTGTDRLSGGVGNDQLIGDDTTLGADNDTLFGGSGADVLIGGGGNDMLLEHDAGSDITITGYFIDRDPTEPPAGAPARTIKVDVLVNDVYAITIDLALTRQAIASEQFIAGLTFSPEEVRSISLRPQPLTSDAPKYEAQIISIQLGEQVQRTPSDGMQAAWQQRDGTDVYTLRSEYITSSQRFAKYEFNAGTSLEGLSVSDDTMDGGSGDDTYYVDSTGDVIIESFSDFDSGGTDVVLSTIDFSSTGTGIEEVRLLNVTGGGSNLTGRVDQDDVLIGNQNDNVIQGLGGNDYLDGGEGADTLIGGKGSDTFVVEDESDVIENVDPTEAELAAMPNPLGLPLDPIDTVISAIDFDLSRHQTIENLSLSGWARNGTGNDKDNVITGNLVSNVLSGGAGNDTLFGGGGGWDQLYGGTGDDTYRLEVFDGALGQASVFEAADEGIDTIDISEMNYGQGAALRTEFALPENFENLRVGVRTEFGTAAQNASFKLLGNSLDNVIESTVNNDTVEGGAGNDLISSSFGQDSLSGGDGDDTLRGEDDNDTLEGGLGNDLLIGGDGDDLLDGGEGDDTLVGDMGDTLQGGEGSDTYEVLSVVDPLNFNIEDTGTNEADRDTVVWKVASVAGELNILALTGAQGATMENVTLAEEAGDYNVLANANDNLIKGNSGRNLLDGSDGNDTLIGWVGDSLLGGSGDDLLVLQGDKTVVGTVYLNGGAGSDTYAVNRYESTMDVQISEDEVDSDESDRDTLLWNTKFSDGSIDIDLTDDAYWSFLEDMKLGDGAGTMNLIGNDKGNAITGNMYSNTLEGGLGDDTLSGGSRGRDVLRGGVGNDTYVIDRDDNAYINQVSVQEAVGQGDDTVIYRQGLLSLSVQSTQRVINGVQTTVEVQEAILNAPANVEHIVNDLMAPTNRADIGYRYVLNATDIDNDVQGSFGDDSISGLGGNDTLNGGMGNDTLLGGIGNDVLQDGLGDDVLAGGSGDDVLITEADGTERLYGGDGNDRLALGMDIETGTSTGTGIGTVLLSGGKGSDIYYIDAEMGQYEIDDDREAASQVSISVTNGQAVEVWDSAISPDAVDRDTMYARQNARIGKGIEAMILGNGVFSVTGYGDDRNNWIRAEATATIQAYGGGGNDTLIGDIGNDTLFGELGDDSIDGSDGNDVLVDGGGTDTLIGGKGDDTFRVYSATTVVKEGAELDSGKDRLEVYVDLGADINLNEARWANIENVAMFEAMAARGLVGNNEANQLVGNRFDNKLFGNGGNDSLFGGIGHDTLDGGLGSDSLDGGLGNDLLIGSINEADTLAGGFGNDTYQVYSSANVIQETPSEPTSVDTVEYRYVTGTVDLSTPALINIENASIMASGTTPVLMKGNALANKLSGGSGNDTLEGGSGAPADTLAGGTGNDTYRIYSTSTIVQEDAASGGSGIDTLEVNYATSAIDLLATTSWNPIENVLLRDIAGAAAVTGNDLDNRLEGNASANKLSGGKGSDTLVGGASTTVNDTLAGGVGDDVYQLYTGTTVVEEAASSGTDRLEVYYSASSLDLLATTAWNQIENVSIKNNAVGTAVTGNNLDNVIEGNALANKLSGGKGNDTLIGGSSTSYNDTLVGGAGNDVYRVYTATTVVQEDTVSGGLTADVDTLEFYYATNSINLNTTALSNVNHAALKVDTTGTTLSGNALANRLTGAAGNDTLIGGTSTTALDTLEGGMGNDVYQLYVAGTAVSDTGGTADSLEFRYATTATLDMQATAAWNGIEHATLKNTSAASITGNSLDNRLTGNGANNTLTGGIGNDSLYGGAGADVLAGGVGNNLLDGGTGNDVLTSSTGDDIAYWGAAAGVDTWTDGGSGTTGDTLRVTGLTFDKLWFTRSGADVVIKSLNKTSSTAAVDTSQITIKNFFSDASGTTAGTGYLESIELVNSTDTANDRLSGAGILALVSAMAGKTAPTTGAITNTTALSTVYKAIDVQWT